METVYREPPSVRAAVTAAAKRGNVVCFLDVTVGGHPVGRLRIELFVSVAPRTCENFRQFCTGEHRIGGRAVGYKSSVFHRVIPEFMVQGGDFTRGDGTGRQSIYGETFADENFTLKHDGPGLLAMANSGPNTNGSQFFICTAKTPHLNGKHVVFGRLVRGEDVLRVISNVATKAGDVPRMPVTISHCGQLGIATEAAVDDGAEAAAVAASSSAGSSSSSSKSASTGVPKVNPYLRQSTTTEASAAPADDDGGAAAIAEAATAQAAAAEEAERVPEHLTGRARKLFELRLKMNKSRKANKRAVVDEFRRDAKAKGLKRSFSYFIVLI